MDETFVSQRRDINRCKTVLGLQPIWPFLYLESEMLMHFKRLMLIDLAESAAIEPIIIKLLSFLKTQNVTKYSVQYRDAAARLLEDMAMTEGIKDIRLTATVLLMTHFKEDSRNLFIEADEHYFSHG